MHSEASQQEEIEMSAETRIYAACLASYTAGALYGQWIDCDGKDAQELQNEIDAMLRKSRHPNVIRRLCNECGKHFDAAVLADPDDAPECPECGSEDVTEPFASAEEWAAHDYDGFGSMLNTEYPSLEDVAALSEVLCDTDKNKRTGLRWLMEDRGMSAADAVERCGEVCIATSNAHDVAKDYAHEYVADIVDIDALPELIRHNIDYEGIACDMTVSGEWSEYRDAEQGTILITNAQDF
jgi:antirestriction protein